MSVAKLTCCTANFSTEDLISYAQNLATTTSRPASLDPPAPLLSAEMLYPVESVMQSGKLAALARGEVVGILGDTQVIGPDGDQPGPHVAQSGGLLDVYVIMRGLTLVFASFSNVTNRKIGDTEIGTADTSSNARTDGHVSRSGAGTTCCPRAVQVGFERFGGRRLMDGLLWVLATIAFLPVTQWRMYCRVMDWDDPQSITSG
jgi:hypothetical protein